MKKMEYKIQTLSRTKVSMLLLCLSLLVSSCKDSFLEKLPTDSIATDGFFKSQADFEQGVVAIYRSLPNVYGDAYVMGEMRSDNTHFIYDPADRGGVGIENYSDFLDTPLDGQTSNKYVNNYQLINCANQVLSRIDQVEFEKLAKDNLKGQALFLRAFAYFDLVKYFGGVPLYLKPVSTYDDAFILRSTKEEVYAQIISDTQKAIDLLPVKSTTNLGKASKGAAQTMLGDVYMNLKKYAEAEAVLKQVSGYELLPNYKDNFKITNKNNKESIFEIQYKQGATEGFTNSFFYTFLPKLKSTAVVTGVDGRFNGGRTGLNTATPDLIACYENGDPRLAASIGYVNVSENYNGGYSVAQFPYCKKYEALHSTAYDVGTNWPVYRYAEVLLFLAEASIEQNKITEALANLNLVRTRAGLPNITETNQANLRDIIAKERRVEFAFENKRWIDLVRTGKAVSVMSAYGARIKANPGAYYYPTGNGPVAASYNVTNDKLIFPIPQGERDINKELTQNPGY
jgi:tetratricopeptide (TPR) repeat protein